MKKTILIQSLVLAGGTLFAWFNFAKELIAWKNNSVCTVGCAVNIINPFFSPCFFGAVFFTIAFLLNLAILKKSREISK